MIQMTSSATSQTHILCPGLPHRNFYPICGLLECTKELVLWSNNHRLSMTQGSSRISEKEGQ